MQACAELFEVSVEALRCALPTYPPKACRNLAKNECSNVALQNNEGYCVECRKLWFPVERPPSSSSPATKKKKTPPGTLLLGPTFMRGVGMPNKLCSCDQPKCHAIGYPSEGLMALPRDDSHRQQWFDAMKWDAKATDTEHPLNVLPTRHRLAYWHFKPQNRTFDIKNGKWRLNSYQQGQGRKVVAYSDHQNKQWDCIVPDNPLEDFIKNEVCSYDSHPSKRWAEENEPAPFWAPTSKRSKSEAYIAAELKRASAKKSKQAAPKSEDEVFTAESLLSLSAPRVKMQPSQIRRALLCEGKEPEEKDYDST